MIFKKIFIALAVTATLASCNIAKKVNAAEANATAQKDSAYGEKIDDKGAITIAELTKQMEGKTELENVKVTAKISEVCQEMGCWMNVDKGDGTTMFVKMKDHEFFLPKDAAGRTAIFSGIAKMDTITVEEQRHYAEDAKKSEAEIAKITEPKFELSFNAAGVIIR
ncbi:MAG: DUF4920 domain-containing protein [Bacteroidia bacterium]